MPARGASVCMAEGYGEDCVLHVQGGFVGKRHSGREIRHGERRLWVQPRPLLVSIP